MRPDEAQLTPWCRGDGRKLRRERETYIFANQIEIALIRIAVLGKSLADLLDQNFWSRSAGSQSNALDAFEPGGVDIGRRIDEFGFDAAALSNLCEFSKHWPASS